MLMVIDTLLLISIMPPIVFQRLEFPDDSYIRMNKETLKPYAFATLQWVWTNKLYISLVLLGFIFGAFIF